MDLKKVDISELLADDCTKALHEFTAEQVAAWLLKEVQDNQDIYGKPTAERIKTMSDDAFPFGDSRRLEVYGYLLYDLISKPEKAEKKTLISELRKIMREEWAKEFDKSCLWCGAKQHLTEGGYCQHPFFQTWDKENTDSEEFENWLETSDYMQRIKSCSNYNNDHQYARTKVYKVRGSHRTEQSILQLLECDPNIHSGMAGKGAFCVIVTKAQYKLLQDNDIKIGKKPIR